MTVHQGEIIIGTIGMLDLIAVFTPLLCALFAGAWVLLRVMIFKPLNEIAGDVKELKGYFHSHGTRIAVLEYQVGLSQNIQNQNQSQPRGE